MFSPKTHRYIFLFGTCALAFGMMLGTVPTSVPQFILLGNWLLEMDFRNKWNKLRSNKLFWVLSSVFLIHVLGLLYTSDLKAGWDDVRTKIPLMFLSLIFFSSKPLTLKEFHLLLYCFLLGSFFNTAWCYVYSFVLHQNEVIRSASRFMSHIRLGLYLNIAIACCIYFIFSDIKTYKKGGFLLLILYFIFSMYALGLASGFANFMILTLIVFCYFIIILNRKLKFILITILSVGIYLTLNYVTNIYSTQNELVIGEVNNKKEKSVNGRLYYHFDSSTQKENGHLVQINVQFEELRNEWNKRCPNDTFAYDNKHNLERYQVLMRYLTSKGVNKDSAGVWELNETDIDNIRNDITNYKMPEWSYLHKRIYELVNEYDEYKNKRSVNGHSLSMRLHFWKTARYVFSNNFITGVGTGDVQAELNKAYKITSAPLSEEWQKRPHNQFLTVAVALGVFGLMIFVLSLILPVYYLSKELHILYWPFFIIAIVSFLIEDTLESQAGLTFFAFFNVLFVSMAYYQKISKHSKAN